MGEWTNCEKIKVKTERTFCIGKIKIKGHEYDVLNKNKDEDNAYIYDSNSGNFHFLPALDTGTNVDADIRSYLTAVDTAQKEIYNKIKDKYKLGNGKGKGKGRLEHHYPTEYKDKYLNEFFKYITVKIGDRSYTINFMKWYIKNNTVNCKFGEIQFDTTTEKDRYVNKDGIYYPEYDDPQSEISLKGEYQGCFYNPKGIGDIWEIAENRDKADKVVEEFVDFICKVKKQIKADNEKQK